MPDVQKDCFQRAIEKLPLDFGCLEYTPVGIGPIWADYPDLPRMANPESGVCLRRHLPLSGLDVLNAIGSNLNLA